MHRARPASQPTPLKTEQPKTPKPWTSVLTLDYRLSTLSPKTTKLLDSTPIYKPSSPPSYWGDLGRHSPLLKQALQSTFGTQEATDIMAAQLHIFVIFHPYGVVLILKPGNRSSESGVAWSWISSRSGKMIKAGSDENLGCNMSQVASRWTRGMCWVLILAMNTSTSWTGDPRLEEKIWQERNATRGDLQCKCLAIDCWVLLRDWPTVSLSLYLSPLLLHTCMHFFHSRWQLLPLLHRSEPPIILLR